jgi:outer membrane protein TolC
MVIFFRRIAGLCFISLFFWQSWARAEDRAGQPLGMEEAVTLALERQPLLQAQADAVSAARESAVAATQLPDPKLSIGVQDFPIDTKEAFSFSRNDFTEYKVGVMQDFPRAEKLRLRGEQGERAAEEAEQELAALRLSVRRDTALAWLEVWRPERAAELARAAVREADLQAQAAEIAYRTARANEAEVLAARVDLQLMRDQVADLEQQAAQARNMLSRWIGAEAVSRPIAPDLRAWGSPPELDRLLARLRTHPLLNVAAKQTEVAQSEVRLAQADYKPDWSVEMYYANRPEFSDFIGVQLSVDLPIFTANRQDRRLAAKLKQQDRAEQQRDDLWRQQEAQARQSLANWQHLQERLARYDREILPQSAQRIEAARLAWQSGQGQLVNVLEARRVDLENRMKRLELEKDAGINHSNLEYLAGEQP